MFYNKMICKMKKMGMLTVLVLALAACDTEEKNEPIQPADEPQEQSQTESDETAPDAFASAVVFEAEGTNTVPNVEGENKDQPFVLDGVRVTAELVDDATLDLYLYGINFSSRMPITIDMVLPGVSYTREEKRIVLSGDALVPMMGENPFDRYTVTGLTGYITADSLVFTNAYGTYSGCSYAGRITTMR